jgi:hypothetical protein
MEREMTDEELVKRLRNAKATQDFRHTLEDEAADRIEALTAERDDYAFKLADANNTYSEMHVALIKANDKLAKAMEVITAADKMMAAFYSNGSITDRHLKACSAGVDYEKSRTTLSELGETK